MKLDERPKHLTEKFYYRYRRCSEILQKETRQYSIAILEVDGLRFAIPFRTHINHKYGYIFKDSPRSNKSGLDFTKAVVITDDDFIGEDAIIDSKEFSEFIRKKKVIANRFAKFIKDYKKWTSNPAYYKAENIIKFSSLQYFHKELGLKI